MYAIMKHFSKEAREYAASLDYNEGGLRARVDLEGHYGANVCPLGACYLYDKGELPNGLGAPGPWTIATRLGTQGNATAVRSAELFIERFESKGLAGDDLRRALGVKPRG